MGYTERRQRSDNRIHPSRGSGKCIVKKQRCPNPGSSLCNLCVLRVSVVELAREKLLHTKRDGSRLVVASRQVLQRDQRGDPVAVLEISNDITGRKRTDDAVREQAGLLRLMYDHLGTNAQTTCVRAL